RDGEVLHECSFENPRSRGPAFFEALANASRHIESLDLVLVGTGPGSYNSLRTSIAAAWGLARARSAQLQGICSLLGYEPAEYHVLGDARANQWFHAHIRNGHLAAAPALLSPDEALAQLTPGVPVFSTSPLLQEATLASPQAIHLARRAAQAGLTEPIYLKPPHITKPSS
ncbi:MAG: tRNA threonylcarbamoyladenosine biosynthesis protein TsaB, partial [Spartobacteria bacterium]